MSLGVVVGTERSGRHLPRTEDLLLPRSLVGRFGKDGGVEIVWREVKRKQSGSGRYVVDSYIPSRLYHSRGRVLLGVAGRCLCLPVFAQNHSALFSGQYRYPLFRQPFADK